MIPFWLWSYLLTAGGIVGLLLAGRKRHAGWLVGLGMQVLWSAYAVATAQWGFLASAFAYGATYAANWWRWRTEPTPAPGTGDRTAEEMINELVDAVHPDLPAHVKKAYRGFILGILQLKMKKGAGQ